MKRIIYYCLELNGFIFYLPIVIYGLMHYSISISNKNIFLKYKGIILLLRPIFPEFPLNTLKIS
jgi:hypothetical protein